ncbi:MAG TPA: hypothetical protein VIL28_04240 [Steroidobacteraceae bacterium]
MKRTSFVAVLGAFALAACSERAANETGANNVSAPPFKPVATAKQIMQGITIPASNIVFAVAGEAPADDQAWQNVEASALAVAESGNLLLMQPRAVDEQEWRQYALALVDAGARAAEAARAKDVEQTSAAGDAMYEVCEQCHAKYLPKP